MFYPFIPATDAKDVIHNTIINIVYEDGGVDLSHLPVSVTFEEVFLAMKPLVSGMVKLNAAKLSHTDIKPDNLVYKKNKVSLIDFGLSCEEKKVYTKEMHFAHVHPYPYYPPEFIEFANQHGRNIGLARNYHYLYEAANKSNRSDRSVVHESFLSLSHNLNSVFNQGYSDDDLFDPSKVDIFSLGATWLILYYVMAQKRKRDYKEIETLILGMLQPIAKNRFDSKKVRKYYNLIWKQLKTDAA
jgi:serine/threonine protein kinase